MSEVTYSAFLHKMGGTAPNTYIGREGEIFWDPSTGALRLSDGTTPGGQAITGNIGLGEANQNAFSSVAVADQTTVAADIATDTLTLVAGTNVTITTDAGNDTVTINSSASGISGVAVQDEGSALATAATTLNFVGAGVTATGTGATKVITIPGGGDANQNAFSNVAVAGQTTIEADSTTDTLNIAAGSNITITTDDGTDTVTISGDEGLATRSDTTTVTSSSIADAATDSGVNITGFKSYALYSVTANKACWIRIYDSAASRTADIAANRTQGVDPAPNAGVIAEAVFTQSGTVKFTPGVFGFNDESTPTTNIPVAVTNNSGSTTTIDISLKIIQLEA